MDYSTSLSFTVSRSLLKIISIESVMPFNHLILCRLLLLLLSVFPSIRVFSNKSDLHIRWPNYWSFSIRPSTEYSGFISWELTGLISLLSKGPLKSLLQHCSSKVTIFHCSAFFMVQVSHPYKTPGKTIVSTIETFAGKVMPLLFNTLSRFVIAFLSRSKYLLISWLQSLSTVIFGTQENKVCHHCFHFFPISLTWVMGLDAMILVF